MSAPFFSVIAVSLNAGTVIRATIDSVLRQSCGDFEIIVKDGGSEDATLAQIPPDNRIRIFVRQDTSVYDAMNQAVAQARGKYLIFMNCGDCFAGSQVLEQARDFIAAKRLSDSDAVYGDCRTDSGLLPQNPNVDRKHFLKEGLCHQSVFFGKKLFDKFGNYDTAFRICADYEIMTRFFLNGARFHHLPVPVCIYQGGGISEKPENLDRVRTEGNMVRQRYFTGFERMIYQCGRIQKRLRKIIHA